MNSTGSPTAVATIPKPTTLAEWFRQQSDGLPLQAPFISSFKNFSTSTLSDEKTFALVRNQKVYPFRVLFKDKANSVTVVHSPYINEKHILTPEGTNECWTLFGDLDSGTVILLGMTFQTVDIDAPDFANIAGCTIAAAVKGLTAPATGAEKVKGKNFAVTPALLVPLFLSSKTEDPSELAISVCTA